MNFQRETCALEHNTVRSPLIDPYKIRSEIDENHILSSLSAANARKPDVADNGFLKTVPSHVTDGEQPKNNIITAPNSIQHTAVNYTTGEKNDEPKLDQQEIVVHNNHSARSHADSIIKRRHSLSSSKLRNAADTCKKTCKCNCRILTYRKTITIALLSSGGGFLFGYDLGLMSGAIPFIRDDLKIDNVYIELIVAMAKIGAFFGTFLAGILMSVCGFRTATAIAAVFFLLGPIFMALANGPILLMIGRFIAGLGIGISAVCAPQYIAEVSRAEYRGRLVSLYEFLLCIGILVSILIDYACASAIPEDNEGTNWRVMMGVPAIFALPVFFILCQPESPRWLQSKGRGTEALAVARQLGLSLQECRAFGQHHDHNSITSIKDKKTVVSSKEFDIDNACDVQSKPTMNKKHTLSERSCASSFLGSTDADRSYIYDDIGVSTTPTSISSPVSQKATTTSNQPSIHHEGMHKSRQQRHRFLTADSVSFSPITQYRTRQRWTTASGHFYSAQDKNFTLTNECNFDKVNTHQSPLDQVAKQIDERNKTENFWAILRTLCIGSERHAFALVMVLASFNQISGTSAIIDYAPTLLESVRGLVNRSANQTVDVHHLACDVDIDNSSDTYSDINRLWTSNFSTSATSGEDQRSLDILYTSFLAIAKLVGLGIETLLVDAEGYVHM
jgi:hypothetical protein